MSWVLRVAKPRRIRRGRRGSLHPVDIYQSQLWTHWPAWRKFGSLALNGAQATLAVLELKGSAGPRQAWRDLAHSLRWNVQPRELRVARESGVGDASGALIGNHDKKGINFLLNPRSFPNRRNLLLDKRRFASVMEQHSRVRIVRTFGLSDIAGNLPEWVAHCDELIFKPGFGAQGVGIFRLFKGASGWVAARGGAEEPIGDLLAWARKTLGAGCVVQERLLTHPDLAVLSPGALPTLRLVGCVNERGAVEIVYAALRLGRGGSLVDNFSAGGLAAAVDLDTGRAGAARSKDRRWRISTFEAHPLTGARIVDTVVPWWDEARAQAILAHEAVLHEEFLVVGWDVALAASGPVVLEGNWNPGGNLLQTVSGRGIADSRLGELYRYHLARIPGERWRSSPVMAFSR